MFIKISKIKIKEDFNVRKDLGDLSDLVDSIKTKGVLEPILVCKIADEYELLAGERRFEAAKLADLKEVDCKVVDADDEYTKFEFMFHENFGRKELTWQEKAKATKHYYDTAKLGKKTAAIFEQLEAKHDNKKRNILRFIQLANIIKEFPQLEKEKTSTSVLRIYSKIKNLDPRTREKISNNELSFKQAIVLDKRKEGKLKSNSDVLVIDELKKEIEYYKMQYVDFIKLKEKSERIEAGIWLVDEVKKIASAARSCEAFGLKDIQKEACDECKKNSSEFSQMCDWWHDNVS